MAITVTVTETPTYVTVNETNNTVTLNQSDNPITVTTSTDLAIPVSNATSVSYTSTGSLPGGNLQDALGDLADQFFRQASTPSGDNLAEGDLWYNTSSDELFVYRQVSGGYEWHTIASAGGSSPTSFTLDGGSFQDNNMAVNIIKIKRTTGATAPSSLAAGELAFSGGTGTQGNMGQRLFIGDPANSDAVTVIGGNYFSNLLDHAHGTTTASSALIVDANKSTSELRTGALYLGTSGSDTLVTATATEINSALDGITSTAAELNLLDGSLANTVVNGKAVIYGSSGQLKGTLSTAAQPNITSLGTIAGLTVTGAMDMNVSTFDIDATDDIDIDTTDTTGGIAIGTANSGVPVSIGHTTSEVTVNDNMTVTGNLTVSGTTTTVNSTTVSVADPVFEIGASGSDDNLDRGIKFKYNDGGPKFGFFGFDDSDNKFKFIPDATDTSSVFSGSNGTFVGTFEGNATTATTVTQAAQTAITTLANLVTVGTITGGVWNSTAIGTAYGGTGLTSVGSSGQILVSNGSTLSYQNIDGGTYS